jgi:hypothetical protein
MTSFLVIGVVMAHYLICPLVMGLVAVSMGHQLASHLRQLFQTTLVTGDRADLLHAHRLPVPPLILTHRSRGGVLVSVVRNPGQLTRRRSGRKVVGLFPVHLLKSLVVASVAAAVEIWVPQESLPPPLMKGIGGGPVLHEAAHLVSYG